MTIYKPELPIPSDCRQFKENDLVRSLEELVDLLERLQSQGDNLNAIKFEKCSENEYVVYYDEDKQETTKEYNRQMESYKNALVKYKLQLKKAYDEEFGG